jgi:hypothetical protein
MRDKLLALVAAFALFMAFGWYSSVHAQTHGMARHEPHMSAAMGHLHQAKDELERATPNKGGHREKAMQLIDEALQQVQEGEQYYEQHPVH